MIGINNDELVYDKIKVYPNPFNYSTVIEFENIEKEKHIFMLYNVNGQLVRKIDNITTEQIKIQKENLINGFYFFKLLKNTKVIGNGKLMIE